jgi:hypothetical protein
MRKHVLVVVGVLIVLCLIVVWGGNRNGVADRPTIERAQVASKSGTRTNLAQRSVERRLNGQTPRAFVRSGAAGVGQAGETDLQPPAQEYRARDPYYDRLLVMQGRDQLKEEEILSNIMAVFGNSPDTLVGAIACSREFCRVDLRGVGEVDVIERWKKDLFAAVDPKGFKFFMVDNDDDGNTMTSFYFGRDRSWGVPDFKALGLLQPLASSASISR